MNNLFANIPEGKKVYMASDFHLGSPDAKSSLAREKKIVKWLEDITPSAAGVVLVGDVFDFWFEYKSVVPKGAVRLLGKLAQLSDSGVPIVLFTGNHDLWIRDYFAGELNVTILHQPESFQIGKLKVFIGHGDGLGPGDRKFKFIKKIFTSRLNQWLFRWLHPDLGIGLARLWSDHSRKKDIESPQPFLGEKEPLFQYCQEIESGTHHDYYIFGHRHHPVEMNIGSSAQYVNLGDWISHFTYAVAEVNSIKLQKL